MKSLDVVVLLFMVERKLGKIMHMLCRISLVSVEDS